jgi:hypothetical protein
MGGYGLQAYADSARRQNSAGDLQETSSADIHKKLLSENYMRKYFSGLFFRSEFLVYTSMIVMRIEKTIR